MDTMEILDLLRINSDKEVKVVTSDSVIPLLVASVEIKKFPGEDSYSFVLNVAQESESYTKNLEFLQLVAVIDNIMRSSQDWSVKYDLIFSPGISRRIEALGYTPDYCDPDSSYEDDVRAYVDAVNELADKVRRNLGR